MTSQSARLQAHGEPLTIEQVSHEATGPDDVLVQLAYSPINPFDAYVAKGLVAPNMPLPRTLGVEASGWVDERPVVVFDGRMSIVKDGLWTESATVPRSAIHEAPEGIDLQAAAAIPIAGVTARHALHGIVNVSPEDRVLVLGAAGGVGGLVVGLARLAGAHVIGQTGDPARAALITEQGADETVVGGPEALAGTEPTIVIDALGGAFTGAAVEALAPGGRIVVFGTSAAPEGTVNLRTLYSKAGSILGFAGHHVSPDQRREHTAALLGAIDAGDLRVPVDTVLPLEDINAGLARVLQRGVRGRILVDLRADRQTST